MSTRLQGPRIATFDGAPADGKAADVGTLATRSRTGRRNSKAGNAHEPLTSLRAQSLHVPNPSTEEAPVADRFCFVLMPFDKRFNGVIKAIRNAVKKTGLDCLRSDDVQKAGFVREQITEHIERSELVVADLTSRNPNVFYETAIAHLKKPPHRVVLLSQKDEEIPFDLRPFRYVRYDNTRKGLALLAKKLVTFSAEGMTAAGGSLFEPVVGKEERTRRIVADSEALLRQGEKTLHTTVIQPSHSSNRRRRHRKPWRLNWCSRAS